MSLSICSALATGGMCALQRMGAIEALEAAVAMLNIQTVQCIFITSQFCWTFSTHTLTRAYSLIPWNPGHHRNGVVNALPSCNTIVELTSMLFVIQAHTESAKVSGCFCSAKRMESIKFRWRRTWLPVIQSAAQWCVVPTIDELESNAAHRYSVYAWLWMVPNFQCVVVGTECHCITVTDWWLQRRDSY